MENTSIFAALATVQSELKDPERAVQQVRRIQLPRPVRTSSKAVKTYSQGPTALALHLTDEPAMVGERYYIKATAILTDFTGQQIGSTAYAREPLDKKGMDESQITGTASSYRPTSML